MTNNCSENVYTLPLAMNVVVKQRSYMIFFMVMLSSFSGGKSTVSEHCSICMCRIHVAGLH